MTTETEDMINGSLAEVRTVRCTRATCVAILDSIFCLALFGLSIAEIVIGAKYLHACRIESRVPIYLFGMGLTGIFISIRLSIWCRKMNNDALADQVNGNIEKEQTTTFPKEDGSPKKEAHEDDCGMCGIILLISRNFLLGALNGGTVITFLFGHVWVFQNQNYTTESTTIINGRKVDSQSYCHPILYTFAYWSIIGRWIAIGAVAVRLMFIYCGERSFACCASQDYEYSIHEDDEKGAHNANVEETRGSVVQRALGFKAEPTQVYETEKGQAGLAEVRAVRCTTVTMVTCIAIGDFIFCLALLGLSIAEIAIGAKYLHECNKEENVPAYLLGIGLAGIYISIRIGIYCRKMNNHARVNVDIKETQTATFSSEDSSQKKEARDRGKLHNAIVANVCGTLNGACTGWFTAGHMWVFQNLDYTTESTTIINGTVVNSLSYCHPTLYKFAFWSIIGRWIAIGVFAIRLILFSCGGGRSACCASQDYEYTLHKDEEKVASDSDVEEIRGPVIQPALSLKAKPTQTYETEKAQGCDKQEI